MLRMLGVLLLILCGTSGCLDLSQKKPAAKEDQSEDARPQQPTGDSDQDIGDDGDDSDDTDDLDDTGGSADLQILLEECGATDLAGVGDDEPLFHKTLTSLPNIKSFAGLSITAVTQVEIKVTKKEYLRITETDVDASVLPTVAQRLFGAPNSGPTLAQMMPFSESMLLAQTPTWKDVVCTFVGAKELLNERGNYKTMIKFDPPFPMQLSPKAKVSRFDKEIGDRKIFAGIKAKIVETDNPKLETGQVLDIVVTVEKVARDTIIEDPEGNLIEVHAESAYKVTTESESPDIVMAMGLDPENTFYLKNSEKVILWNVLDTKSSLKGILKFNHNP